MIYTTNAIENFNQQLRKVTKVKSVCSCRARLTPEEPIPHMKAHAINGENHSYRAY